MLLIYLSSYQIHFCVGEVPAFFLTEKDLAVISRLYSFKDFYGVIGSDHLFVKHNLMKKQGHNNNRLLLTEGWAVYSDKSSAEEKLNTAKALVARSLVLIGKAEASVSDLELNKRNVATALRMQKAF
ncbi:hypothetical protein Fot_07719 [Forsythia ovata]|uniref:Uncharacterized protein n=1 Tax=Forsythia ovata TaxID=205694 RepID=A0ABD1WWL6_9LAMI